MRKRSEYHWLGPGGRSPGVGSVRASGETVDQPGGPPQVAVGAGPAPTGAPHSWHAARPAYSGAPQVAHEPAKGTGVAGSIRLAAAR